MAFCTGPSTAPLPRTPSARFSVGLVLLSHLCLSSTWNVSWNIEVIQLMFTEWKNAGHLLIRALQFMCFLNLQCDHSRQLIHSGRKKIKISLWPSCPSLVRNTLWDTRTPDLLCPFLLGKSTQLHTKNGNTVESAYIFMCILYLYFGFPQGFKNNTSRNMKTFKHIDTTILFLWN